MRTDPTAGVAIKAQFATKAWLEADALEAALSKHTCSIERAFYLPGTGVHLQVSVVLFMTMDVN